MAENTETLVDYYEDESCYLMETCYGKRYATTDFGLWFGYGKSDGAHVEVNIGNNISEVRGFFRKLYANLLSAEDHNRDYDSKKPYTQLGWHQILLKPSFRELPDV